MSEHIEIETIHAGQLRPYSDSIYEAIITYSHDSLPDYDPIQIRIENIAKVVVHNFKNKDEERGWWEAYLDTIEKLSKGKWRIKIIEPYTD